MFINYANKDTRIQDTPRNKTIFINYVNKETLMRDTQSKKTIGPNNVLCLLIM